MTLSTRRPVLALAALALAAAPLLAACGGTDDTATDPATSASPTPSESPSQSPSQSPTAKPSKKPEPAGPSVDITIEGGNVTPLAEAVEMKAGETLVLTVTSDREGELHVHSSPEQTYAIAPGTEKIRVTLERPGTVDIEEHESGVLVVRALVR